MVRELVGGLYFGDKEVGVNEKGLRYVKETLEYDEEQICRIMHEALRLSMRRKKYCIIFTRAMFLSPVCCGMRCWKKLLWNIRR